MVIERRHLRRDISTAASAQLTTDGHHAYLEAVEGAFGSNVDYAMLVKLYGIDPQADHKYSPAKCLGIEVKSISGAPEPSEVCTSHVERQNLTMRIRT